MCFCSTSTSTRPVRARRDALVAVDPAIARRMTTGVAGRAGRMLAGVVDGPCGLLVDEPVGMHAILRAVAGSTSLMDFGGRAPGELECDP